MAKTYVNTKKITGYDNGKKLIEFTDRLVRADVEYTGYIHQPCYVKKDNTDKIPSRIGVTAKDYSKGTGEAAVDCNLNIEPKKIINIVKKIEEHKALADSIFLQLAATEESLKQEERNANIKGFSNFLLYQKHYLTAQKQQLVKEVYSDFKIMPYADQNGLHKTTSFKITYQPDMNLKWKVYLKNSAGKLDPNKTNALLRGSELPGKEITIFISDDDLLNMLYAVDNYISAWEHAQLPSMLDEREIYLQSFRTN